MKLPIGPATLMLRHRDEALLAAYGAGCLGFVPVSSGPASGTGRA